ncbi:MAG: DUF4105 domain-containing protein [Nevskiaceae bacterium]|nr:MAG: DUF4105 domain-containing protein [Nevskiaceae bacterium]
MKRLLFLLCLACSGVADAAGDPAYLAELQAQAKVRQLAQARPWQRLLHLQPDRIGQGYTSTISFAGFFNAPEGRDHPAAELDATLAVFFSDTDIAGEPPQCRFKARYEWLKSQLDFDDARLPPQPCTRYDAWAAGLNARHLAVVFASNDLNSPSSMFGHTLLRVDAPGQGRDERLLAYALNYAATDIDDNGAVYAWRGITGSYTGYFSIYPYYEKVKEYARFEHRDLWEYPLELSPQDTQRLLWHVWELRGVGSNYYFFSQNCSFQLLSLIEAARPDLDLTHRFLYRGVPYAIPIDTIRQLRDAGVLGAPDYRPANAKRLQHELAQLGEAQRIWVLAYARGDTDLAAATYMQAEERDRARMLETAHELLYFRFQEGELSREAGLPRDRAALLARSRIATPADFAPVPQPETPPDAGHDSGRLSMGLRADAHHVAALLRLRPAYHDRLDPPAGYLAGGELEFFDLGLLANRKGVQLDDLRLLSVQAVSPRSDVFKPWSWQASTGLRRSEPQTLSADPQGRYGPYVDGGGGMAWAPWSNTQVYGFAFGSADLNADAAKGYLLRGGLRTGAAVQWSSRWTQQLELDELAGLSPQTRARHEARLGTQWQWCHSKGLRLNLHYTRLGDQTWRSGELLWQIYF